VAAVIVGALVVGAFVVGALVVASLVVAAFVGTEPERRWPARVNAQQSWVSPVRSGGRLDVPDRVV
jgi:hypothetical protein